MKIPEIEKKDLPALFGKKYQIIKIEEDEVLIRELQDETPRNDDHLLTVKISEIYKTWTDQKRVFYGRHYR